MESKGGGGPRLGKMRPGQGHSQGRSSARARAFKARARPGQAPKKGRAKEGKGRRKKRGKKRKEGKEEGKKGRKEGGKRREEKGERKEGRKEEKEKEKKGSLSKPRPAARLASSEAPTARASAGFGSVAFPRLAKIR